MSCQLKLGTTSLFAIYTLSVEAAGKSHESSKIRRQEFLSVESPAMGVSKRLQFSPTRRIGTPTPGE